MDVCSIIASNIFNKVHIEFINTDANLYNIELKRTASGTLDKGELITAHFGKSIQ